MKNQNEVTAPLCLRKAHKSFDFHILYQSLHCVIMVKRMVHKLRMCCNSVSVVVMLWQNVGHILLKLITYY